MGSVGEILLGVLLGYALGVLVLRGKRSWLPKRPRRMSQQEIESWEEVLTTEPPTPPPSQGEATMGRVRYGVNRPGRTGVRGKRPQ